jgi:LysR family cyn operon transcriptional activator
MELRHIRYFAALAETQSFTKAAEKVHVTQSTLSHQIKQLEDEIGLMLCDRTTSRVSLTTAGETFLEGVLPALRQIDKTVQAVRGEPAAITGHVRIGVTHSFNYGLMPTCVSQFVAQHASIQIRVEESTTEHMLERLDAGDLDLVVTYRPAELEGLHFEPLYNEEMELVVAQSHPAASLRRIRMVDLHGIRMILLPQSYVTRQRLDECFASVGSEPVVVAEMNAIGPTLEVIRSTDLAGILGRGTAGTISGVVTIPLESPNPVRVPGLIYKENVLRTDAVKHFASLLRRVVLDLRPAGALQHE